MAEAAGAAFQFVLNISPDFSAGAAFQSVLSVSTGFSAGAAFQFVLGVSSASDFAAGALIGSPASLIPGSATGAITQGSFVIIPGVAAGALCFFFLDLIPIYSIRGESVPSTAGIISGEFPQLSSGSIRGEDIGEAITGSIPPSAL